MTLKKEIGFVKDVIKDWDKKVVTILISVAVLQTISWYYTSWRFFRIYIYDYFSSYQDIALLENIYWFFGDFITLLILPVLIIKLFLKEKISDYGLKVGDYKTGLKISSLF